jgi:murein DD-endopeptidase MepM/ murein hydrolase activator NlpD
MRSVQTLQYERMKKDYEAISSQFLELRSTMASLKKAEVELKRLLSLQGKERIFEEIREDAPGSLDVESLRRETDKAIESVTELKRFLREQRDLFFSIPRGWPVEGELSSRFGRRLHPITGEWSFHSGIDIRVPPGSPVMATADGVVSYSGWTYDSGYTIVLEHGHGFSTVYAHNRKNYVRVGQRVRRGELIAISGDTGSLTGPHLHYEVWKDRRPQDPEQYLGGKLVEKR